MKYGQIAREAFSAQTPRSSLALRRPVIELDVEKTQIGLWSLSQLSGRSCPPPSLFNTHPLTSPHT